MPGACYLPEIWASNPKRRKQAGIPENIQFETKPQIALGQIRQALAQEMTPGIVVADAGYGVDTQFRRGLSELDLEYVVGVQSSATVWEPGKEPLAAKPYQGTERPPRLLRRDQNHQPLAVKQLARTLPMETWTIVNWRQGSRRKLRSRFAAVRIRPAHRDYWQAAPHAERMAADGVAQNRRGADKILVLKLTCQYPVAGSCDDCQTALDYRTGLRGTETGTRSGPL